MKIVTIIASSLLPVSLSLAQNTSVTWTSFGVCFGDMRFENSKVVALAGQPLLGQSRGGSNFQLSGGFLFDGMFGSPVVAVENQEELPLTYGLSQNYPNPFNPSTIIRFEVPVRSQVTLKVYNVLGQVVRTLINDEERTAGRYEVRFEAAGLSSGAYFYRLHAGDFMATKKLLILR
jgi:hypothetical protein